MPHNRGQVTRSTRIACIGDSTCWGTGGTVGIRVAKPYPLQLFNLLNSPYFLRCIATPLDGLINLGVGGSYLSNLVTDILPGLEKLRPDIVIVTSGVNDCARGDSSSTILANMTSLVTAIHNIGALAIIDDMLPIGLATGPEAVRLTVNGANNTVGADAVSGAALDSRLATNDASGAAQYYLPSSGHPSDSNSGTDVGGGYGVKALYCQAAVYKALKNRAA